MVSTKSGVRRLVGVTVGVIGIFLGGAVVSHAQRIGRGGYGFTPPRFPTPTSFAGKGGFLLAADYHGTRARAQFDDEIGHVLPPDRYPIVDLTPPNHAMWNTLFPVKQVPQLASIQTWRRTGGVLERWNDDRARF